MAKSIQKCLIMLMSAVIAFTCLFVFEAALPQYALTAYAASISAPSVKAENTSPTSVNLKWKKVKGAKKYVVYRSTKKNKGFKAVKTIKKSSTVSYTDKKLKAGSTYYYKVAAVNGKSKKSSKAVKIKAIPSAVKGIDGESKTCSTVTVVFNKQSGVSGYDVQYSATENGKYKTVSLQKGTSFNHTIGEGAIGFYKVRAYITVKGKKIYGGFSDIIGIEAYSHSYNQSVVEPTCIAGGYTLYTCSVCSSSYTTNPTPVTSHKFGSYIIDKDATCATTGSKHKTCSVCGFEQYKSIEATGEHSYGKYTVTTAPTCQQGGIETSKCSLCGKAKTRETAIVDHSYGEYSVSIPATCTTDGTKTASCIWCAITITKAIDKTGHSYGEFVVATPSTCTTDGVEEACCSNCDSTITRDIPATGHSYGEYSVTTPATCTENGIKVASCTKCATELKQEISATGHEFSEYVVTTPASCIANGIETAHCAACEKTITREIPAIEHSYTMTKYAASCTEQGYDEYTCSVCGNTYKSNYTDALGHSYGEYAVTTPATDTENGVETATCAICGTTKTRPIAAIGHSYGEYVVTTPATCTSNGIETAHCADCEKTITREIPAIEHSYTMTNYAASCTEQGYDEYTCSDCGNSYRCNYTNALGHSYGDYAVVTPASCAADGVETAKCVNCEATISRDIPAIGHSYGEYVVTTPAACTTDGVETATCASCGATITRPIAAFGHNPQIVKNEMGYIENKCINCNELYSIDTTCYIDLTSRTISVPSVASFTVSASGNDKLDLNYDGVSNYEITGTAENLSIDVNATADCEVKLAGVTITNTDLDIINIKDKSPNEADEAAAAGSVALDVIPVVAISAKVDTVNTLTTKAGELVKGGKIIDSDCRLELKGRGTINMDTTATAVSSMDPTDPNYPASTAIRNSEKIYIKNLTLDIKSANRGIDTKKDFKDAQGNVYDTEFYNIELSGNAKITITSTDDGIRCKNFDSNYLTADEVDSTVTINAGGDGIQLEGKSTNRLASMILHSGTFNINGTKSIINNKSMKVPVADGTATANFATIPPSMAQ